MDIAIPRLRWNQREMIAPVVPGATPPEKKEMTNPNTTVNMMTLLMEASAKYESPITARLTMTTIRPPRTSTSLPRKGCEKPFRIQPTAAAADMAPVVTCHSRSQVSTKTPKPWRVPSTMNMPKNIAPTTYQP